MAVRDTMSSFSPDLAPEHGVCWNVIAPLAAVHLYWARAVPACAASQQQEESGGTSWRDHSTAASPRA